MNIKNLGLLDIGFIKFSVLFFTLFLVSFWSDFAAWVIDTNWVAFLAISLILAIKPIITIFKK